MAYDIRLHATVKLQHRRDEAPIIKQLVNLIKKKENREVAVDLEMSQGLKKIRDLMTHEGYKHVVSKVTLQKLTNEIEDLESVLFPSN